MAIGRSGAKAAGPVKARVDHGLCNICYKPIRPGEVYYAGTGGTNTRRQGKSHKACYDPS